METYDLRFKDRPNERGYWSTTIYAENDKEAIQKAERLKANGKYYSVILEKITYKYKTVKKWED